MHFNRDRGCTLCPLHESARNACIPTRLIAGDPTASHCVVLVGNHPGVEEDQQDRHFVGVTGSIAEKAYAGWIIQQAGVPVAIYGVNAVRCRPPDDVTNTQARKCTAAYLWHDIEELKKHHEHVVLLAAGGPAAYAITTETLGRAMRHQGQKVNDIPVFATFNPAILLPGRDPSMGTAISDHLLMVADFLTHGKIPTTLVIPTTTSPLTHLPVNCGPIVSLDIETYGCVEGMPEQTVFHPEKMVAVDGVAPEHIVQTAAAAWRDTKTGKIEAACWVFPEHLAPFISFIGQVVAAHHTILGMNLCFDLMCLRYCYAPLRTLLARATGLTLADLAVANFLNCDVRPERSLKDLAPLLRVHDYDTEKDLSTGFRYSDRHDPELHYYNRADAAATLELYEKLRDNTLRTGPTARFSPRCLSWYSDLIWNTLEMDEAGARFDRRKLEDVQAKAQRYCDRYLDWALTHWDIKLAGPGSRDPTEALILEAATEAGLLADPRLNISKKRKIVSADSNNRNLLEGSLPLGHRLRGRIRMLSAYKHWRDTVLKYTTKYLSDSSRGLTDDMAWPTWYVTVSREAEQSSVSGGTRQGRQTCSNPGRQLEPAIIKGCITSRFANGMVTAGDLSQIERRMMALFSWDPLMVEEYQHGLDCHMSTGMIFVEAEYALHSDPKLGAYIDAYTVKELTKAEPGFNTYRQLGKTANFLMGFRGGASTLQATARKMNRIELDIDFCRRIIRQTAAKYPGLTRWQDSNIAKACRDKYLELPIIGDRRSFRGSSDSIRASYTTAICNFPIQTWAARLLQSAQRAISDEFRAADMRAIIIENCYDSVVVDHPAEESNEVNRILGVYLAKPPLYTELTEHLGRSLPIDYELKVLARIGD